jgi:uncharacterized membrane protein
MNPAITLAIGAGLCWGIGELFTKSVLHTKQIGPITAITIRTTVALPILWAVYWFVVVRAGKEPRNWWRVGETTPGGADLATVLKLTLGSGVIAGAVAMICFYSALHMGEISRIKPIAFALAPAVAVLLGWLILQEPMSLKKGIGVAMILAGVVVLTGK